MYPLVKSKLKFELCLVDNSKLGFFQKNQTNRIICMADTYEVMPDGSVTFYQSAKVDDRRIKVPVLTYPSGKWEAVLLVDENNYYPVFNVSGTQPSAKKQDSSHELNDAQSYSRSSQESHAAMPSVLINVPGVSNNPPEYKKAKNEWLEKLLKDYIKGAEAFKAPEFISFLKKDSLFAEFRPNETDIEWSAANLIREKQVPSRKFTDPVMQKNISLILPDLMKRQWAGKMSPILEALNDREEAKNATCIDLAVWMAANGY